MYSGFTFLAIIPARSGSKGLPDKNIKMLCGKPLLAWSIESALDSSYIDEVCVSTDSTKYADIAKAYGANVPFLRPKNLASDTSSSFEAIKHCIDFYKSQNKHFDYIILLEPTSPLRESSDINNAIHTLLANKEATSIVGISLCESSHPAFLVRLENGFLRPYENLDFKPIRRQDLPETYFFEGSLYISECDALLKHKNFYHLQSLGYIVPKWKSLEIDDIDDFAMVEAMMKTHLLKKETK